MIVAFWNNLPGQIGTTSNLVAIAAMASMLYKYKTLLIQSRPALQRIDDVFGRDRTQGRIQEEYAYFVPTGMDYLLEKSREGAAGIEAVEKSSVCVYEDQLYYLPASRRSGAEAYERKLLSQMEAIFQATEDFADLIFIDCGSGRDRLSQEIMDRADRVVVNFNQNPALIRQFFENRYSFQEKCVFLVGRYDQESQYNLKNIHKLYRIPASAMGAIPYNVRFQDAFLKGDAISFLKKNIHCKEYDYNAYFMEHLRQSAKLVLKAGRYG